MLDDNNFVMYFLLELLFNLCQPRFFRLEGSTVTLNLVKECGLLSEKDASLGRCSSYEESDGVKFHLVLV